MLVQDDMGEWSVFELSPHGHTCTPYRDRIYQSHSTSIVLFPVESTAYLGDSIRYRQRIYREVQSALAADQQPYEPLEILKGCGTKLFFENQATWNYAAADANSAQQGSREYPYSPSLQIIIKILQHSTDVTFEHQHPRLIPLERITPDDFFNGHLSIINRPATAAAAAVCPVTANDAAAASPVQHQHTTTLGAATVIRDM